MFTLFHLAQSFIDLFRPQRDHDEAFLAQASDLCDLERRIRVIEDRGREAGSGITLGLYAR